MSKKISIITIIVCIISIILSLTTIFIVVGKLNNVTEELNGLKNNNEDIQYVLYLGTNDKDTNTPVFDQEKAKNEAKNILLKHFGGFTIQEANGGWKDGDKVYEEYTFVIYLSDTTIDKVHEACKEMIEVFNQSSILIQTNKTITEFYNGK